jgi:DNA-binding CsgD family transcriptional regulator
MSLLTRLLRALGYNPGSRLTFKLDQDSSRALKLVADEEKRPTKEVATDLLLAGLAQREAAINNLRYWHTLTPRQQQIASLVCLNYTNRQIATKLMISPETVKTHVSNILYKFNLRRKADIQNVLADWDFSDWET